MIPPRHGRPVASAFLAPRWPVDSVANGVTSYVASMAEGLRLHGHEAIVVSDGVSPACAGAPDVVDVCRSTRPRGPALRALDRLGYRLAPSSYGRTRAADAVAGAVLPLIADRGVRVFEMEESFGLARDVQRRLPIPVVVRLHGPWFLNGRPCRVRPVRRRRRMDGDRASARADRLGARAGRIAG